MAFNTIPELIEDIRAGKMVLLVDDEDRENEGDLVCAADHITPEVVNFMAMEARGLICLSLGSEQIDKLGLPLMVRDELNYSPNKTAFTVSIEASFGVTTGISAADRAHTIRVASSPIAKPSDIHTPGHVFPIRAQSGGVLKRAGHTEGSVDLARLAGHTSAAVICEVMNADGTMARVPDLKTFAQKHKIKIGTIVDLIEHRLQNETLVEEVLSAEFPEQFSTDFKLRVFRSRVDSVEHIVLQKGEISKDSPILVRVHSENATRDLISSLQFGSTPVQQAMKMIAGEESGVVLILRDSSKPGALAQEFKMALQSPDEAPMLRMDRRDYGIGAQILRSMGIQLIRLISNRPEKRIGLKAFGLEIVEVVPLAPVEEEKYESTQKNQSRRSHSTLQ
ncbi:MAG: 3,4-dihydroxy-2-butanone-4-phosphate synthase [Pseudobdellovibrionaceae bacterium]